MAYFKITYGVSFDNNEEYIEAKDYDEAIHEAWVAACADYDSYGGLHGIPSEVQIAAELYGEKYGSDEEGDMEDGSTIFEHMTDAEIEEVGIAYREERESWIAYDAVEVSQAEYENGGELDEEEEKDD